MYAIGISKTALSSAGTAGAALSSLITEKSTGKYTAVSREIVQQNHTRQCQKVVWVMGVPGP